MHYVWLYWSLIFVGFWAVAYALLRSPETRKEMLLVSLWTSLVGLTEPFFVSKYWNPPSLFDLAQRTGFDIESIIFSFAMGGLAVALYEMVLPTRHARMPETAKHHPRHRYHVWALLAAPIIFVLLLLTTPMNPIYATIISLFGGGFATWYCRPDLKGRMAVGALLFLGLYTLYFQTLIALAPGYVERVWNLPALSGKLIFGIPLEEYLFALSLGFLWSSIYEHWTWRKTKTLHN